jgi:ribosome-associated heat shock protein Hsp15
MRLDQWLWEVRVFHTRSRAAEAIKAGRVSADCGPCKPAHEVKIGELVVVRFGETERAWRVVGFPKTRVGAKLVPQFAEEVVYGASPLVPGGNAAPRSGEHL